MSTEKIEKNVNKSPRKGGRDVDMTQGDIFRLLLNFAMPLLIGNLFQQLYNTVDTWVLGNYASKEAFAAIGTITPVFMLFVNTFVGLSNGAGVVISNYYGAGQMERVKRTVHTSMILALMGSVFFTIMGLLCKDTLISWMKPSPEMVPHAQTYLGIIFQFLSFQIFYNICASIMRAVGDSRRPFYYLVIACVTNIVLDIYFVRGLGMGASGVAYATVIAQGLSAVLSVITLFREDSCIKFSLKELCFDKEILVKILKVGIPTAIQMAVVSFSNIFVMSYINQFGTDFSSGYAAYFKTEIFLFLPVQSISLSATTFVGQNFGAGNIERAKKGVRVSIIMCLVPIIVLGTLMEIFAPNIIGIFNSDPTVVNYGAYCLRFVVPFYIVQCFSQVLTSALRGVGDTLTPMIIMVGSYVGFRQLYLFVVTHFIINVPLAVVAAFPLGWTVGLIFAAIRYHRTDFAARFAKLKDK